jgi:tRNA A37 threonylcarbamoyladenosine biosynthesis protein TsaE
MWTSIASAISTEQAIVIVEWPEKFTMRTDWPIVRILLEHVSEDTRKISLEDPSEILPLR